MEKKKKRSLSIDFIGLSIRTVIRHSKTEERKEKVLAYAVWTVFILQLEKYFKQKVYVQETIQAGWWKKNLTPTEYDRDISIDFTRLWIKQ